MVAQEEVFVPVVERRGQEKSRNAQVPHLLEAAIGRINAATHDPEFAARHLLAQMVVLGKVDLLVKSSELVKAPLFEKHEHSGAEGMVQAGKILKQIIAGVEELVGETPLAAKYVGGDTMQFLALCQFDGTAHQRRAGRFDVSIKEKHIGRVGEVSAGVPASGGQTARNYANIEPIAEAHDDFPSSVGGVGVSYQHSRIRHPGVVLTRQRIQQARNQLRLVLCRNHNGQVADRVLG
jgi:hypothetical protein